jgi:hypothetical protein
MGATFALSLVKIGAVYLLLLIVPEVSASHQVNRWKLCFGEDGKAES